MSEKDRVDRLDDAIIAEAMSLDHEELAGLVSDGETVAAQTSLNRALAAAGKLRLARAKSRVALYKAGGRTGGHYSHGGGARVQTLRRQDPYFDKKLTLAARSGKAGAEADAAGLEEDLGELDAWQANDRDPF
jgi:hypothetical protein